MGYLGQRRLILLGALLALALATAHVAAGVSTATTRWIVFSATPDGKHAAQLFRIQTTGAGIQQITIGTKIATQPSFSPDGKRVVFTRLGSGIFVVNLDGSGQRRLTNAGRDHFPVWSPDGKHIAFLRLYANRWRLYVMTPSGGAQHRVSSVNDGGRPSWTANSKSIYLPVQAGLQRIDARTGRVQKQLVVPELDLGTSNAATMSPNSKRVAFVAPRPSTPNCEDVSCPVYALYLAEVPSGKTRRFANNTSPAGWSADSSKLVFVFRGGLALWPVASKTATITLATGDHVAAGDSPPAWQPR
jgi:Tol biopolymer transport system component